MDYRNEMAMARMLFWRIPYRTYDWALDMKDEFSLGSATIGACCAILLFAVLNLGYLSDKYVLNMGHCEKTVEYKKQQYQKEHYMVQVTNIKCDQDYVSKVGPVGKIDD